LTEEGPARTQRKWEGGKTRKGKPTKRRKKGTWRCRRGIRRWGRSRQEGSMGRGVLGGLTEETWKKRSGGSHGLLKTVKQSCLLQQLRTKNTKGGWREVSAGKLTEGVLKEDNGTARHIGVQQSKEERQEKLPFQHGCRPKERRPGENVNGKTKWKAGEGLGDVGGG